MSSTPDDLAEFYPRAYQRLVGTLRVMGVPEADAIEVAQEAFVRLIPRWGRIRAYDRPDSWLRTVAWRVWLNRRRSDRLELVEDVPDRPAAPTSDPLDSLDLELDAALRSLVPGQREVIALHYLADLSVRQIASELAVAEGTVKARLHRGRAALAEHLRRAEINHE